MTPHCSEPIGNWNWILCWSLVMMMVHDRDNTSHSHWFDNLMMRATVMTTATNIGIFSISPPLLQILEPCQCSWHHGNLESQQYNRPQPHNKSAPISSKRGLPKCGKGIRLILGRDSPPPIQPTGSSINSFMWFPPLLLRNAPVVENNHLFWMLITPPYETSNSVKPLLRTSAEFTSVLVSF